MVSMGDFLWEVKEGTHISDLILILSVPLILSVIFQFPESIQDNMVLDYGSPSVFNLWSAAYVHRGPSHFSNNTVNYCILIVPIYLLFMLAGEKNLFRYIFLSFLFVLPVIIALINIAVIGQGTGAGFSGIVSAFFGLLPVSLVLFIHHRISEEIVPSHGVLLFLVAAGIIALIYAGVLAAAAILSISALLAIYNTHDIGVDEVKSVSAELISMRGYFELVLFAGILFLVAPGLLFPQELVQNGNRVNILAHYVGFTIGFFGPIIFLFSQ